MLGDTTVGIAYSSVMEVTTMHAHLPRELVERLDEAVRDELRSCSNMLAALAAEGTPAVASASSMER